LKTDFFFAHPFTAWERGANENMNGLVRQYIPKKREFAFIRNDELQFITDRLNHRPRKCLDYLTPSEVFLEAMVALES
jgi:IS30 family transposase